jgi:hypothetical protein
LRYLGCGIMLKSEKRVRLLFGIAVAALAAALGDLFVETLSNHGIFGPGHFTDGSNADVAPVGVVGSLLLLVCLLLRVRYALTASGRARYRHDLMAALSASSTAQMLPAILCLQIALLWIMETAEQYLVIGHGFGGTIWLGGPVAASLLIHAAICSIVVFAMRGLVSMLEPRALQLVRTLLASTAFPPRTAVGLATTVRAPRAVRWSVLREIAKRGPPAALLRV